jgi:hypothetical protein
MMLLPPGTVWLPCVLSFAALRAILIVSSFGRLKPPRAKAGRRRPHLITSVCVREDVEGRLRGEYMTAALLLTLVVSAIDTVTVAHGRIAGCNDCNCRIGSKRQAARHPACAEPGPHGRPFSAQTAQRVPTNSAFGLLAACLVSVEALVFGR